MKLNRFLVLIFAFAMLLTSCMRPDYVDEHSLENGRAGELYKMKSDFINTKTVTLYYPDLGSEQLLRIVKEIRVVQDGSEALAIANQLLNGNIAEDENYSVPFGGHANVYSLIVSRNLASINLHGSFSSFTEKEIFSGVMSVVNTLCELKSIDYVEVLINDNQMRNRGLLINPMSVVTSSLYLTYLDHLNILEDEERKITRDKNILYFLDKNSNFLIAEISNVAISKDNAAEDLFNLLKDEPYYGSGTQSSVPQNILMSSDAVLTTENDMNILIVRLETSSYESLDSKTRYMMCGGITLTLLSYFDNVSALRILVNGQPALVEQTLLTKLMFSGDVGQIVTVFLPNRDLKYLVKVDFAMNQKRYNNPKEKIKELMHTKTDYKTNTEEIIPFSVEEQDILSVFIHDSCCVVNISEALYTQLCELQYNRRKMFIYAVVNTMTATENINNVQFLVEGRIVEKLGNDLYIETSMLKNPGLVFD